MLLPTIIVLLLAGHSQGNREGEVISYTVVEGVDKAKDISCNTSCGGCIQGISCYNCDSFHCALQKVNNSNNVMINI